MDTEPTKHEWRTRWLARAQSWGVHLADAGLDGIAQAFALALRPLGPVVAQVLWFAQPGLGLIGQAEAASALADLLDDPAGLGVMMAYLSGSGKTDIGE